MRRRAKLHTDEAAVEYVPKSLTSALEFDKSFFAPCAARDRSRLRRRCVSCRLWRRKIRRTIFSESNGCWEECGVLPQSCAAGSENARLLRMESNYAVTQMLPPGSVTTFHLAIPRSVAKTATSPAACFHPRIRILPFIAPSLPEAYSRLPLITADYFHQSKSDRCHQHIWNLARAISFSTH